MTIDLYIYGFLGAGLVAGRVVRVETPWVGRSAFVSVVALLFFLGASLASLSDSALGVGIPVGLGIAALVLAATVTTHLALFHASPISIPPAPSPVARSWIGAVFATIVVAGFVGGRLLPLPSQVLLSGALYVLLFLVAFDFRFSRAALRDSWKPIVSASMGAVLGGLVFAVLSATPVPVALSITLGFGWYTLTGPLVGAYAGAFLGLVAFLANFLRENLTMVFAPIVGPRVGGPSLIAMGGATSMDTTLPFIARYGGTVWTPPALTAGFVLTVGAGLVIPLLLSIP